MLVERLPVDSATMRAFADVDSQLSLWKLSDILIGRLVDETTLLRWQWESAHLDRGQRPRKQPSSVLPAVTSRISSSSADVIPLVSAHQLGGFIDDDSEGSA